jgi:hypothetical protein
MRCQIKLQEALNWSLIFETGPCCQALSQVVIHREYMHFGNFTDIKGISKDFSDCGLHNDKYTKFQPVENCVKRASITNLQFLWIPDANLKIRKV